MQKPGEEEENARLSAAAWSLLGRGIAALGQTKALLSLLSVGCIEEEGA